MKKAAIILMITASARIASANQSLEGLNENNVHITNSATRYEQCIDEYEHIDTDDDDNLQEYEQYVCDHVKPPKISAFVALLNDIGGRLLIQFITFKEIMRRYWIALQATINAWISHYTTRATAIQK